MGASRQGEQETYPALSLAQQREQFASMHKVHDHIQIGRVLERPPEVDDKRVRDG